MLPPALIAPGYIARKRKGFPSEVDDVILRSGIAESIKELAADYIRGRAQFRKARRIKFQQVAILAPVFNDEPGCYAVTFGADNAPCIVRAWRCRIARPALELGDRHSPEPMPIRVPSAVWYLAQ